MKSKSIQQSLLEEILALQQPSSINPYQYHNKQRRSHHSDVSSSVIHTKYNPPLSYSISDLQDQILKMRIKASKIFNSKKNIQQQTSDRCKAKMRILKTQASQDQGVPPMNYSTIYTRRSSLDESLYNKAIRQQSIRKQWVSRKKKQQQSTQLKECSYKPQINKTSNEIMSRVNKQELYDKIRRKKQESIRRIIEQQEKNRMKQCSFTPNIQNKKKKVVKSVKVQHFTISEQQRSKNYPERHSVSIFDHLYADSIQREIKNKKHKQKYIKQSVKNPKIDQISKQITRDTNFETRMLQYQKKKLQKCMQIKQKQNKHLRQSYRPTINNSSATNRSKQISIGQYLFLQSKKQNKMNAYGHDSKNKKKQTSSNTNKQKSQKSININKKSEQVYEERKIMVFYQIFKLLDGDQDGIISVNNLTLSNLPHQVIKIIYPLIEELQLMEVQLHEQEFIGSISNLFKTLTVHQRDILLGFIGNTTAKQSIQIKQAPKMNTKSRIIASYNQRSQMSIYDYCSIKQAQKQKQLQSQRIQKNKKQLQMCTFHPKITNKYKY